MSDDKITQEEVIELFGADMPIEAAKLLWTPNGLSISEVREKLREMAAKRASDDNNIVEAMARARCDILGIYPDGFYRQYTFEGEVEWSVGWHSQAEEARCQLVAHRAMIKGEKE
jgi:hypothetical protein